MMRLEYGIAVPKIPHFNMIDSGYSNVSVFLLHFLSISVSGLFGIPYALVRKNMANRVLKMRDGVIVSNKVNDNPLSASAIVVIVSLIVCLPIETWCFELCTVYLSSLIEGYMELYLPAYIYVELIVIGLISYFAINAIHMIKVRKIPMNEALKNRE